MHDTVNSYFKNEGIGKTDAELKLQYFICQMRRDNSLEKTLMLGRIEGRRRRGRQRMRWMLTSLTRWTWIWANSGRQWGTGKPGALQSMGSWRVRQDLVTEQQKSKKPSVRTGCIQVYLGRIDILIILSSPVSEHGIDLNLFRCKFCRFPGLP